MAVNHPTAGDSRIVPAIFADTVNDSDRLFWLLNIGGWAGLCVVNYVSLSLPYDQVDINYIAHNVLQSVLGIVLSVPLRRAFRSTWDWSLTNRVVVASILVVLAATVWTILRLALFLEITDEEGLWGDFGGWLFTSLFVFLTWVALYHGVKFARLLARERESLLVLEAGRRQEAFKLVSAESAAREAQLKLLRYQLNPHFLFNTLNSIAALIGAKRSDDAQTMLAELSTFLRFSLESDRNLTIPLRDEIEALDLYLRIEQVRFSDRLTVDQDIDPRTLGMSVPSLILQPLVENAIKHAIAGAELGGSVTISARLQREKLVLIVEDSGTGKDDIVTEVPDLFTKPGFGLRSTAERLENLYGEDFSFNASKSPLGGLRIELHLPQVGG